MKTMSSIVLYPLRLWYLTLSQNVDGVGVRGRVGNPDGREGGHENHSVVLRHLRHAGGFN